MNQTTALSQILAPHFPWHGSRVNFLASFIIALFQVRTVNLTELSVAFAGESKPSSKYKRLQRFFRGFELNYAEFAQAVLRLMNIPQPWVLSLDRTNWKLGKANINFLVLGVVYQGIAFPLLWTLLDKKGNSNTDERIEFIEAFLESMKDSTIDCLVADREFIGADWFYYLLNYPRYRFHIRLKVSHHVGHGRKSLRADVVFANLRIGETRILRGKRVLWGATAVYVSATRLEDGALLILASSSLPKTALTDYAKRWSIETLFGILKSQGFRLEDTHMTEPERLKKLLALLTIALAWAVLMGEVQVKIKPLKFKKHGRLERSLFRYGFDTLRRIFLNYDAMIVEFKQALQLLAHPGIPESVMNSVLLSCT